jgi:hypothetical protein
MAGIYRRPQPLAGMGNGVGRGEGDLVEALGAGGRGDRVAQRPAVAQKSRSA